jgi:hypothetical protein
MMELKRPVLGRLCLISIIFLLSACNLPAAVKPAFVTPPVNLLSQTSTADFFPPTGAPATLSGAQPAAANPSAGQAVSPIPPAADTSTHQPAFDAFVSKVKNGNANQVVGVYVENVMALRVVQQPPNQPDYVSVRNGEATQFLLAFSFAGNTGLLAHNFLSGKLFFNLKEGDVVEVVYGDGSIQEYEIDKIESYQALNPDSPTSDFLDVSNGETLSATDLFYRVYGGDHHVTFQTCIAQGNNSQWGRFFVLANPL